MADILVDDKNAQVIAFGVSGKHEEPLFAGIVCFGSPQNLFSIAKGHFDGAAVERRFPSRVSVVSRLASEVLHEENRLRSFISTFAPRPCKGFSGGRRSKEPLSAEKLYTMPLKRRASRKATTTLFIGFLGH